MTRRLSADQVDEAATLLQQGELVAFPTETVFGLGASLLRDQALDALFKVKGRPLDNPLIVHIPDLSHAELLTRDLPQVFFQLAERFWPGPFTMIVPKSVNVSKKATGGLDSVALRIPSHKTAQALLRSVNEPLVAPSANLSGKPSGTCIDHVLEDFDGKIAAVIEGSVLLGIESTVVSLLHDQIVVVRPGCIAKEEIEAFLHREVALSHAKNIATNIATNIAPGMKYRHYAPLARVELFLTTEDLERHLEQSPAISRLLIAKKPYGSLPFCPLSMLSLYDALRKADHMRCDEVVILCDVETQKNAGLMNRLEKAASTQDARV